MPPEVFQAALSAACRLLIRDERIVLSGGEPTLHPLFWEFMGLALKAVGGRVNVITNGSRTADALRLAEMAEKGQIFAGLSLDRFHAPIDPVVVDAFRRPPTGQKCIVGDKEYIISCVGRAAKNKLAPEENGCDCDSITIKPNGEMFACSCYERRFGTVFNWNVPSWYLVLKQSGECCCMKRLLYRYKRSIAEGGNKKIAANLRLLLLYVAKLDRGW
jgi:hypothetical protein